MLYGAIQWLRRSLYQSGLKSPLRLPGKVISVGNLEVGGTGKSPVTIALASRLVNLGLQPAIVTRGYRSGLSSSESVALLGGEVIMKPQSSPNFLADEGRMQSALLQTVPIIIGARRALACQRYLGQHPAPSHWILDDGFQHMQIFRDCNIVLMDAQYPFDNGLVLPSGRLREWAGALQQADYILLTRAKTKDIPTSLKNLNKPVGFSQFFHGEPKLVHSPQGQTAPSRHWTYFVICAIAKPESFKLDLLNLGFKIAGLYSERDHNPLDLHKFKEMIKTSDAILTTEKDFYRDPRVFEDLNIPVVTLPLKASIDDLPENLLI